MYIRQLKHRTCFNLLLQFTFKVRLD